jgi:hypothetical protein
LVRNTFINLPVGRPLSMDEDFYEREVGSCPATVVRAPPGLIPWPRMPSFDALDYPDVALCSPLPSPELPHASPLVHWPRTMSGDCLQDFLAVAHWPRTMSGDCLQDFLAGDSAGSDQQSFGQCEESSGGLAKPALWPRTMSGDLLEVLAEAADAVQHLNVSSSFSRQVGQSFQAPGAPPRRAVAEQGCFAGLMPPPPAKCAPAIQEAREVPPPPRSAPGGTGAHTAAAPWPAVAVHLNLAAALDNQSEIRSHGVEFELGSASVPLSLVAALGNQSETGSDGVKLEIGTADMPTVGSAGHNLGICKPCAFFHSKGCQNGVNCTFCHLCLHGEKKRRQKDRKQLLRAQ